MNMNNSNAVQQKNNKQRINAEEEDDYKNTASDPQTHHMHTQLQNMPSIFENRYYPHWFLIKQNYNNKMCSKRKHFY